MSVQTAHRSAQSNNADGLYNAALLLKDGKGVERDDAKAYNYLSRAVQLDHLPARIQLAALTIDGRGIDAPDCHLGTWHFKIAAEKGR